MALTAPRQALALAADRGHAGRSGTDLLCVIVLVLLATQLRGIVGATWLATAVDLSLGTRALIQVLSQTLTVDLVCLVIAAGVLFAAGGRARNLGRAFDLACVAVLPLFFVALTATVLVRVAELVVGPLHLPNLASLVLAGISYAWTGALVALALRPSRVAHRALGTPRAGWAVIALVLAGIATQAAWLATNVESVRPMIDGDPAPAFALPRIATGGGAGAPLALAEQRGKIVVLDFWATWCGPCLRAMPKLETLSRRFPDDVVVIAVNLDDAAKARAMFDEGGYKMLLVADDGHVSERYGVSTIPHSVIIDRAGVVQKVYRGGTSELAGAVEAMVKSP